MATGVRLTKRVVDAAQPKAARYVITDSEIAGFRLVVSPSGGKAFAFRYRVGGGRGATIREPKLGDYGSLTVEQARAMAADWAAKVQLGADPSATRQAARTAPRMADLFARFLADYAQPRKKASSIANDERLIEKRLAPVLGKRKVAEVTRANVADLHKSLAAMPYEANRCLALLSKAFNLAEVWGWRPDGSNPVRHVAKYPELARKRFLAPAELAALGGALRLAETDGELPRGKPDDDDADGADDTGGRMIPISQYAIAAIRLLILTGARKGEILGLRWADIDFEAGRAHLADSKTGAKVVILPPAALAVLASLPRLADNPHVIVGGKPGAALVNIKDPWAAIRAAAGLSDVRIHDLRHSFASIGAAGGLSLPIIGALLGHTQASTTQRYAHLADDPLQAAAAAIGAQVAAAMAGGSGEVVAFANGAPRHRK